MALMIALAVAAGGDAQPPGKKGGGFGKGFGGGLTAEQIVERIMAFDKNGDGKITKEELPERMQHLIALGDTNKDGALDKEEVVQLANLLQSVAGLAGPAGPGGFGAKGGPFGAGFAAKGAFLQQAVDDLNLTGTAKEKATALVKAHQEKVRKFQDQAHADLLRQMKEVLSEEDYKAFKAATDRPPGALFGPPPFAPPNLQNLEKSLEQIQKDLDDLRRKIQK
jgi:hypothetical protein